MKAFFAALVVLAGIGVATSVFMRDDSTSSTAAFSRGSVRLDHPNASLSFGAEPRHNQS
jgi:2-methylaconitate cis-trans-isomerase PrpF